MLEYNGFSQSKRENVDYFYSQERTFLRKLQDALRQVLKKDCKLAQRVNGNEKNDIDPGLAVAADKGSRVSVLNNPDKLCKGSPSSIACTV